MTDKRDCRPCRTHVIFFDNPLDVLSEGSHFFSEPTRGPTCPSSLGILLVWKPPAEGPEVTPKRATSTGLPRNTTETHRDAVVSSAHAPTAGELGLWRSGFSRQALPIRAIAALWRIVRPRGKVSCMRQKEHADAILEAKPCETRAKRIKMTPETPLGKNARAGYHSIPIQIQDETYLHVTSCIYLLIFYPCSGCAKNVVRIDSDRRGEIAPTAS